MVIETIRRKEVVRSWWVLLTFTLFAYWAPFLYIGVRARQRRWILAGIGYFLAVAQYFVVDSGIEHHGVIFGISLVLLVAVEVVAIIHAFRARSEALLRFDAIKQLQPLEQRRMRQAIAVEYGVQNTAQTPSERLQVCLAECDNLIEVIEQDTVALDLLPSTSRTRTDYLRALQDRADGFWLMEHAATPANTIEAERKLRKALTGLQTVRDVLETGTAT